MKIQERIEGLLSRMIKSAIKDNLISQRDGNIAEEIINGVSANQLGIKYGLSSTRIMQVSKRVISKLYSLFIRIENQNLGLIETNAKLISETATLIKINNDLKTSSNTDYNSEHFSILAKEIGLGNKFFSIFPKNNINTFGELINYSAEELLKIRGFGKRALVEVEEMLDQHHLKLKGRR
jgi:hypothetical protein